MERSGLIGSQLRPAETDDAWHLHSDAPTHVVGHGLVCCGIVSPLRTSLPLIAALMLMSAGRGSCPPRRRAGTVRVGQNRK
ncbi:MAG: hypothetical protein WKH64_10280 [Chloroflexia bacterium]